MEETTLPRFSCLEYLYICSMKRSKKNVKIASKRRKQKKVNQPYHKVLMHFRRSTRHKLKAMSSSSSRHWIDVRQGAGNRFPVVCGELLPERTHSPIIIISAEEIERHTKEGVVVVVRWLVFCCQRHARVPCPDSSLSIEKLIPDESTDRKLVQKCFIFKSSYTTRLRII